jgi:EPS-associated MarR family transcriptional regulator
MKMDTDEEYLKLLRKINEDPEISQRNLSSELDISLGKINYCLKALKTKGLIKIKNFKKNKDKIGYLYYLTPKGIAEKTNITIKFMKLKMKEYDELKKELSSMKSKLNR